MINKIDIPKGKRILGIDYGKKRTGFAISDELHITCRPIKTIDTNSDNFFEQIKNIIDEFSIYYVVIGIPFTKDGNRTEWITEIELFIENLKSKFNLNVYTIDESFSSKRASALMIEIGMKKNKRRKKENIDRIASAIILQEFLDQL
jgi:putative Holliday junction resolvase